MGAISPDAGSESQNVRTRPADCKEILGRPEARPQAFSIPADRTLDAHRVRSILRPPFPCQLQLIQDVPHTLKAGGRTRKAPAGSGASCSDPALPQPRATS